MLEAENCPYPNEQSLLNEFDRSWQGTGTRIVMWGIKSDVKLRVRGDIVVNAPDGSPSHERSLRSFAEVLYLKVGTRVVPKMQIILRDEPVAPCFRQLLRGLPLGECAQQLVVVAV